MQQRNYKKDYNLIKKENVYYNDIILISLVKFTMTMKMTVLIFTLLLSHFLTAQDYTEEAVAIGELKGTLSIPAQKTKTAILMISGSGPTDRDGNSAMGFRNNSLKMVAQQLAENGYAVLRFDKRGIASSAKAITDPASMRFDDFISDAEAWLSLLEEKGYKNLVVAGHSQGSLVGMIISGKNEKVKGFISLAGLGEDAGTALVRQLEMQAPILVPEAKTSLDSLRAGHKVNKVNPFLASLFGPQIQDFLKSYIMYDPSEEIKKLDIPVLIINGTTDIQVDVAQAETLGKAYPNAQLEIVEGMNHILKDAPSDPAANMATYNDPELPLSDGLMGSILTFIANL